MKVYAHYKGGCTDGNSYRWRTLLQFGDSWKIIGSVVMINPGSARPLNAELPIQDNDILLQLNQFCDKDAWYAFSNDTTMRFIRSLFKHLYQYRNGSSELNGVIQIFNLMNIMEENLDKAKERFKNASQPFAQTTAEDIANLSGPIYLGWGSVGKEINFFNAAKSFFDAVICQYEGKYLDHNFKRNPFYHPRYLMHFGRNKKEGKKLLEEFCRG